jgi:hypothetical protein
MASLPGLTWLDPAIHLLRKKFFRRMNARVKPGHDDGGYGARRAQQRSALRRGGLNRRITLRG